MSELGHQIVSSNGLRMRRNPKVLATFTGSIAATTEQTLFTPPSGHVTVITGFTIYATSARAADEVRVNAGVLMYLSFSAIMHSIVFGDGGIDTEVVDGVLKYYNAAAGSGTYTINVFGYTYRN